MRQLDLLRAGEKRRERAGKPERGVGSLGESGRFLYSGDRWRFGGSEVISLKVKNPPFSLFFFFCLFVFRDRVSLYSPGCQPGLQIKF
ncbi:mCG1032048 [Mus musculus]|nr:mCG1032048 [Mus musculus]